MEKDEFKKCPNCGQKVAISLYFDELPCTHCNSTIRVDYCTCTECNYSYRLCNGKFFDGSKISEEELAQITQELEEALLEGNVTWQNDEAHMTDHIVSCIRCSSPLTYKESLTSYHCSECDFSWEMLEYE